jgi:biopolymer transport protein ExbD
MKRRVREHEKTGELNIVPYLDIMVNLTMFMLVSMTSVIQFGILNVAAPNYGPAPAAQQGAPEPKKKPDLLLSVAISTKGFIIAGSGMVMGQAQDPKAPPPDPKSLPPTIPLLPDGKYDFTLLTRKLVDVKDAFPQESKVILMADQSVPYEILIQTMDAIREDGPRRLFYDVALGAL